MNSTSLVPTSAPFSEVQRAWLEGFLAGFVGIQHHLQVGNGSTASNGSSATFTNANGVSHGNPEADSNHETADYPWHDPNLTLAERESLAAGKPIEQQMMAVMGQLDCGQCGYLCASYAKAICDGSERDIGLCVPGGKATKLALKDLASKRATAQTTTKATTITATMKATASTAIETPGYSRAHPFEARLITSKPLTMPSSEKDIRFVAIDLAGSGLKYSAGDSLGVYAKNCPEHVDRILDALSATGAERLAVGLRLRTVLTDELDLRRTTDTFWELCKTHSPTRQAEIETWAADERIDLLTALHYMDGTRFDYDEFTNSIAKLQPRLYSISSSPMLYPEEVHLTVGVVKYQLATGKRIGVASTFLTERTRPGDPVRVFIQPSTHFRVPAGHKPMIMIGPGTGVAPFRAFLQERAATQATGHNWLFFGAPRQRTDFLYEAELLQYLRTGLLTRLDTAFSRDQDHKIYVQDRLTEHGREIFRWLEQGAHLFVCGDARRMAKDVDQALRQLIAKHGDYSETQATEYLGRLLKTGRYSRDVY